MRSLQAKYARPKGIFSQLDEDYFLIKYFKEIGLKTGRFLDIGAYDGHFYSNTCYFGMQGWSGLCVEAAHNPFAELSKMYKPSNTRVKCLHAAITVDLDGEIEIHETDDPLSTTLDSNRDKFLYMTAFEKAKVPAVSMRKLAQDFPGPYHLISIDTEGTSVDLALAVPNELVAEGGILCIEEDIGIDDIIDSMKTKGFSMIYENGMNSFFIRDQS